MFLMTTFSQIGDEWKDGACTRCSCRSVQGYGHQFAEHHCEVEVCDPKPPQDDSYVVLQTSVQGKCCPVYTKTACKMDNTVYQVQVVMNRGVYKV